MKNSMKYPVKYFPYKVYDGIHAIPRYFETYQGAEIWAQWADKNGSRCTIIDRRAELAGSNHA